MKRLFLISSLIILSSVLLVAQEEKKAKSTDQMAFETLSHDYGSIVYDADGTYKFKFTNNSDKPIVITNVKSSCGCTIPSWPKEPVQPGEKGSITVKYNTKLPGTFNKTVQVFSTAENSPVKLIIRGKVNAKASDIKSTGGDNNLLNGTRVKEGVNQGNSKSISKSNEDVTLTASEEKIVGGTGELSKSKEEKKRLYQEKIEAAKKSKK